MMRAETYSLKMSSRTMKNDLQKMFMFFMLCSRKIIGSVSHIISTRNSSILTYFCNLKLYYHEFSNFRMKQ
eukprot:UN19755